VHVDANMVYLLASPLGGVDREAFLWEAYATTSSERPGMASRRHAGSDGRSPWRWLPPVQPLP
jgi:hypothetical protein